MSGRHRAPESEPEVSSVALIRAESAVDVRAYVGAGWSPADAVTLTAAPLLHRLVEAITDGACAALNLEGKP